MPKLVSVVIEWENAKLSDLGRAERMLAQLGTQMAEAARKRDLSAELIVLYDSDAIDPAVPSTAIETQIDRAAWPGPIKLVPAPGQRYYEQKNKGAKLASGEIVIFLDSDVVPDEGWLEGLLAALDDPEVGIVGGETYHATDTLHDKLFAAFWTFPTRRPSRGLYRCKHFYANNFAVRRELFLAHPFPDAPAYRGQCAALAKSLMRQGTAIYRQGASRVSHPPPEGAPPSWCARSATATIRSTGEASAASARFSTPTRSARSCASSGSCGRCWCVLPLAPARLASDRSASSPPSAWGLRSMP